MSLEKFKKDIEKKYDILMPYFKENNIDIWKDDFFKLSNAKIKNILTNEKLDENIRQNVFWTFFKYSTGFLKSPLLHETIFKKIENRDFKITFDLGANIGVFSSYLAEYSESVYAFEPLLELEPYQKEVSRNYSNINFIHKAVGDKNRDDEMLITRNRMASYSLSGYMNGEMPREEDIIETREVEMISIDNFVEQNNIVPDFIKMDAEGMEYKILKGAEKTLKKYHPTLMITVHDIDRKTLPIYYHILKGYDILEEDLILACTKKRT